MRTRSFTSGAPIIWRRERRRQAAWSERGPHSLVTGKLTGNFWKFRMIPACWRSFGSRSPSGFNCLQPIPCSCENREFFLPEQGIHRPEQGICGTGRPHAEPHRLHTSPPIVGQQRCDAADGWSSHDSNHARATSLDGARIGRDCLSHTEIAPANGRSVQSTDTGRRFGIGKNYLILDYSCDVKRRNLQLSQNFYQDQMNGVSALNGTKGRCHGIRHPFRLRSQSHTLSQQTTRWAGCRPPRAAFCCVPCYAK